MQFNLSSYIRILKTNSKSASTSDESFVCELFDPFVVALGLKNKFGKELKLDKHQVSKLLNQEADVPSEMRKHRITETDFDAIMDGFEVFVNEHLGRDFLEINQEFIWELINNDPFMSEAVKKNLAVEKEESTKFLVRAFLEAVKINNAAPKTSEMVIWSRGNSCLKVLPANIINKAFPRTNTAKDIIVVIPVNTSFETEVTPSGTVGVQLVSENTIHGKWLTSLYGKKVEKADIDKVISESLMLQGIEPTHNSASKFGKQDCYPIGTIAIYKHNRSIFYLWAISEFDEKNRAQSTKEIIKGALELLIDYYDAYGQGDELYLPLVGTGRSRANMTHQESYDLIKRVVSENENKVHGIINILVLPDDYDKIRIF